MAGSIKRFVIVDSRLRGNDKCGGIKKHLDLFPKIKGPIRARKPGLDSSRYQTVGYPVKGQPYSYLGHGRRLSLFPFRRRSGSLPGLGFRALIASPNSRGWTILVRVCLGGLGQAFPCNQIFFPTIAVGKERKKGSSSRRGRVKSPFPTTPGHSAAISVAEPEGTSAPESSNYSVRFSGPRTWKRPLLSCGALQTQGASNPAEAGTGSRLPHVLRTKLLLIEKQRGVYTYPGRDVKGGVVHSFLTVPYKVCYAVIHVSEIGNSPSPGLRPPSPSGRG